MHYKYLAPIAEAIASISNFDERKQVADRIGSICADGKNFDGWLWHKACQTEETPIDFY